MRYETMKLIALCAALGALHLCHGAEELTAVDTLRLRLLELEGRLWRSVEDERWNEVASQGSDVELTRAFRRFNGDVQAASPNRTTVSGLDDSWLWAKMSQELAAVGNLYQAFDKFVSEQARPGNVPAPVQQWLDLAETVLMDPTKSVVKASNRINELLIHSNLFRSVLQDSHPDLCNLQQSPHQLLYNMYNTISLTEIKGYAMMQFSWMLLKIYGKGNFTQEANLMRQRYEERTALTVASIKSAMAGASREMYRCDPAQHEEGETYEQITRLLQGYVENEVDMNPDGTCKENCAFYTLAQNYGCYKDQYCARQASCTGRIISCQYVDSDMWICPARRDTNRRYEWIEYENGRTLGRPGSCMRGTSKVDSWWRWLFWHCSYCMCLCDEPGRRSDRFFSLHETVSAVHANKVVTGIRFVKVARVVHLQINEGVLKPRATIDPTTTRWQPVERMNVDDDDLQDGVDYHTLTYERRAIDLDELEGPDGHVLTGVRFRMIGAHLHFEIRTTPFNYTTGKLFTEKSEWISNDNTDGTETPRSKLNLHKPDIPTRSPSPSRLDSKHDQYLEFTHSDMDADAAQTTVPYIDAQPVLPTTPVPLVGAGVAHKGQRGYGGFLTPKIVTYNYAKHMHAKVPDNEYVMEKDVDFVSGVFK